MFKMPGSPQEKWDHLQLLQVGDKCGADSGLVQLRDRHLLGACAGGVMHNLGVKQQLCYYPDDVLQILTSAPRRSRLALLTGGVTKGSSWFLWVCGRVTSVE